MSQEPQTTYFPPAVTASGSATTTYPPLLAPRVRTGELALYAILGAFLGYELVAHFTHYRYGRTLSAIIVAGDHSKILWLALACRALVIGGGIVVVLHLSGWLW